MTDFRPLVNQFLENYFSQRDCNSFSPIRQLFQSIEYSLLGSGKRYRPQLALSLTEAFQKNSKRVLPFAAAVEMIHTYSLIHDDLPCMDNDDFRRGQPTNHKIFGEGVALLSGDALLTEAFYLLADAYRDEPSLAVELILKLSEAAGVCGMVGGQAIDISTKEEDWDADLFLHMHGLKTGALIRVSAEGAAMVSHLPPKQVQLCREYGAHLGLAFQLADDLDDYLLKKEVNGFPYHWGAEKTRNYYEEVMKKSQFILNQLGIEHAV